MEWKVGEIADLVDSTLGIKAPVRVIHVSNDKVIIAPHTRSTSALTQEVLRSMKNIGIDPDYAHMSFNPETGRTLSEKYSGLDIMLKKRL